MVSRPPGRRRGAGEATAELQADPRFQDSDELRSLITEGRERGYLTFEQIASTLEEVEVTKEQVQDLHGYLIEHGVDVVAQDGLTAYKEAKEAGQLGQAKKPELDLTVEPSLDSLRLYLRSIGRVELLTADQEIELAQADREGRHGRQAPHGGGQPAPGRLDREGVPGPWSQLPRPDPGGVAGADPRGREVRLPPRLQVLDLRHLVDPPGGDQGDRRQGADDPDPRSHGGEAEPGRPRGAPAGSAPRTRARAGGDREGAEGLGARGQGHPAGGPDAGVAGEADGGRGRVRAGRLRRRRDHRGAVRDCDREPSARGHPEERSMPCRSASAR